ncbi:hypothetical protein [Helicobacter salomonis]|uniref:hypothetical protein n=1 Tax=Helicobacter salomonis TaxID=56878 RepID=UPI000CF0262B|nr:hypothetical protein [Helicobacter salomonis]
MEDNFEQALQSHLQEVLACQKRKGVGSCLQCGVVLTCKQRQAYVQSVYMSMNKGQQGSFEF